jgi:Protein of unknown function (DUF3147)
MLVDLALRALVGGTIVSVFALLGDILKPKSFAGLFGAAPSVALASLALTYQSRGAVYVATEAQWMVVGAIAFAAYAWLVCRLLRHGRYTVRGVAAASLIGWFVMALGVWRMTIGAHQS